MTGVQAGEDTVEYIYNVANKLTEVKYPDGTYVKYGYDAFGRKVSREEAYWNKEAGDAPGKSEYAPGQNKEKSNNGKGNGNDKTKNNGNSNKKEKINPLKLKTDTTTYLYDGFTNAITNEYTGNGSPLSQYNMANDRVVSKKTFGNHGQVIPGREPSLKTNGGLMYYSYDGMRNVTELTDRHGDSIEQYRYDAFGGLYTGVTAPYNTNSFAGKSYDAKANLIDMNARWYGAQNGRFTTADPYAGDILTPYTQNRYAYVGNNPINRWDPLGYWEDGDSGLSSAAQADIRYLTKLYNSTDDKDERASIHEAANEIRSLDRDRWTTEDERKIGSWSGTPDIDYDTSIKLSGGWRTDWTRTDKYYEKYEVTRQRHTAYAGVISTTVSNRTDTTTTVTNGFDFRAFTPSEWYQENKAVLKQYHIPISQVNSYYEPKDAYSKTTSRSRTITSTEKIISRNDNNDFKNGIISQGLKVAGVSDKIVGIGKGTGNVVTNTNGAYNSQTQAKGNIVTASTTLPKTGEPNSKGVLHNPDGSIKQEREYGPDGQPTKDTDYNHGGVGHEFPHEHEWKDRKRQPGVPVPPVNNQAITPSSSDSSWWVKPAGVGLVIVAGAVTVVLIVDDATGIGALDDPLVAVTGGGVAKGLEMVLR